MAQWHRHFQPLQFNFEGRSRNYYEYPEDATGNLPLWLSNADNRDAEAQLADATGKPVDWLDGFILMGEPDGYRLFSPMDIPPLPQLAWAHLHNQTVRVYPYGYVVIVNEDGTYKTTKFEG